MTIFSSKTTLRRWRSPEGVLALGIIAGLALWALPSGALRTFKDGAIAALRPGRAAGQRLDAALNDARNLLRTVAHDAAQRQTLRRQLERLEQDNRRLRTQLATAQSAPSASVSPDAPQGALPLLVGDLVPARVLGSRARRWLSACAELDVGARQRLAAGALALEAVGLDADRSGGVSVPIDVDRRHAQPGQLVLSGWAVCGKLVEVGGDASWVQPVTASAYRDEVLIVGGETPAASLDPQTLADAPRGVLEGTGDGMCRVRLVAATAPVAVGDVVYAAGGEGVWRAPPCYGKVVSAQRPPDSAHWEINVRAATAHVPGEVVVLRLTAQPLRTARRGSEQEALR